MILKRVCKFCGNKFDRKLTPSQLETGRGKYCRRECYYLSKKGYSSWMKGRRHTKESKEKMTQAQIGKRKGKKNSFYGRHHTEETRKRWSEIRTGRHLSQAHKTKLSNILKGRPSPLRGIKLTKERIRKMMRRRLPTSLELKFQAIIDKHTLPYGYVGNGAFILGNYNPDFINVDGEKIAIEVYSTYYKKRHNPNIGQWKSERREIFKKFGWQIMFFDETQVNEEYVSKILKGKGGNHASNRVERSATSSSTR